MLPSTHSVCCHLLNNVKEPLLWFLSTVRIFCCLLYLIHIHCAHPWLSSESTLTVLQGLGAGGCFIFPFILGCWVDRAEVKLCYGYVLYYSDWNITVCSMAVYCLCFDPWIKIKIFDAKNNNNMRDPWRHDWRSHLIRSEDYSACMTPNEYIL